LLKKNPDKKKTAHTSLERRVGDYKKIKKESNNISLTSCVSERRKNEKKTMIIEEQPRPV